MKMTRLALLLLSLTLPLSGCQVLSGLLGDLGLELLGVTPSEDYRDTGKITFNLLPIDDEEDPFTAGVLRQGLASAGLGVQLKNEDGSTTDCTFIDERELEGSPYNAVMLLIDDSGSMEDSDPTTQRAEAASRLASIILEQAPDSVLSLSDFGVGTSGDYQTIRQISDFSGDPDLIKDNVNQIMAVGGTPLWDALAESIQATSDEAKARQDASNKISEMKRYVIVLSDGEDTESWTHSPESVIRLAKERDTIIHAVGLASASASCPYAEPSTETIKLLQRVAQESGGYYASAAEPAELEALYQHIALSMTGGYNASDFDCIPDEDTQDRTFISGQPLEGSVILGESINLPWRTLVP
ncbi:VWA domain-containing protein [Myxococcota bacterium]|nr:VWA domain-containing protein [Myxococcota bacterium]MBU1430108.1 VWA domain-containing protein [Myxococcota bacterium]MBU1896834.1 VWA domain-containing protein [Myxococcota bacterium]